MKPARFQTPEILQVLQSYIKITEFLQFFVELKKLKSYNIFGIFSFNRKKNSGEAYEKNCMDNESLCNRNANE